MICERPGLSKSGYSRRSKMVNKTKYSNESKKNDFLPSVMFKAEVQSDLRKHIFPSDDMFGWNILVTNMTYVNKTIESECDSTLGGAKGYS